ncbi:MAG: HK97 family phage prohead protease [Thermoguttaceae bacterium]|nr:HK97 family phage prohead protease [Thermoguttaceae bacterium]
MTPTEILLQAEATKRRAKRLLGPGPHRPPASVKAILERARRLGFGPKARAAEPDRERLDLGTGTLDWVIEGLAVSYDRPIRLNSGSTLYIHGGAFRDWTDSRLPFVALEHEHGCVNDDPGTVIASAGLYTLRLIERDNGLHFRARPANTLLGMRALSGVWDGSLTGASVNWVGPTYGRDAAGERTLLRARLREISLTGSPCDQATYIRAVYAPRKLSIADPDFAAKARAALLSLDPPRG